MTNLTVSHLRFVANGDIKTCHRILHVSAIAHDTPSQQHRVDDFSVDAHPACTAAREVSTTISSLHANAASHSKTHTLRHSCSMTDGAMELCCKQRCQLQTCTSLQ